MNKLFITICHESSQTLKLNYKWNSSTYISMSYTPSSFRSVLITINKYQFSSSMLNLDGHEVRVTVGLVFFNDHLH